MTCLCLVAAMALGACNGTPETQGSPGWETLEDGLEMGVFPAPRRSEVSDSLVRVLRIDPERFDLRLLNASAEPEGKALSPREWAERHDLVAVINASMYQEDGRTSVSLMRSAEHVNNAHLTRDMAVLAFDRRDPRAPRVKIIDRECEDFDAWDHRYHAFVQSIRMLSCRGENVWTPQSKKWSTAAVATDAEGRVLFLHVRSPYDPHELIDMLRELPLGIERMMYVEGGTEAQLVVRSGGRTLEMSGTLDAAFEDAGSAVGWPVPNVIGVVRRSPSG